MCKHCEIAWVGDVFSLYNFEEILIFWGFDTSQWFLFETNDRVERSSLEAWRKRQPEGMIHE